MGMREADTGSAPGNNAVSPGEVHSHRDGKPALSQPSFNWNATDKYGELLCFELEVMNIIQTKTCELTEEEKVPIIKNWLGRR